MPKKPTRPSRYRGARLYNYLLSELTKANNANPDVVKMTIQEKRKYVSEKLYPRYQKKKLLVRALRKQLASYVKKLPSVLFCNPLNLPPNEIRGIEYYDIYRHLQDYLLKCINVKVNAGAYGSTQILNTKNLPKHQSEIIQIINNLRADAGNTSGNAVFNGQVRVRPGKKDDQKADSYYIEYILSITGQESEVDLEAFLPEKSIKSKGRKKEVQSNVIKYNQELEAVRKLYRSKRISKAEFEKTKNRIMRDINKIKRK
jgi:hypothetical protein